MKRTCSERLFKSYIDIRDNSLIHELYLRHRVELKEYFKRYCHDEALAEDTVQNVFIRIQGYEGPCPAVFFHWLARIGHNILRDEYRKESLDDWETEGIEVQHENFRLLLIEPFPVH